MTDPPYASTRAFVAGSPFCLVATADADGSCDVSPRGGPPGFVRVPDACEILIANLGLDMDVATMREQRDANYARDLAADRPEG